MIDRLQRSLISAYSMPFGTDWNRREQIAFESLKSVTDCISPAMQRDDVFLGGDILRPYVSVHCRDQFWIVASENQELSRPKLLAELDSGVFGELTKSALSAAVGSHIAIRVVPNRKLTHRLAVPSVYLTTLTNATRYQARRYPLNVSRLAQWARFQHAARVRAVDLALTFEGDVQRLAADIAESCPDILGVSINFGELDSLQTLIALLRDVHSIRPVLCVGNVLASWASGKVRDICDGFELVISASYGESVLEHVCRAVARRACCENASAADPDPLLPASLPLYPQAIVYPDEQLLAQTMHRAGQPAIETSFGCQYGRCSFCPRDHRSKGWRRPAVRDSIAVIRSIAARLAGLDGGCDTVLSIVDEDAFGSEGLDPRREEQSIVHLVNAASSHGIACEIYTRAEQLFNPKWKRQASINRLQQLAKMQPWLGRVFVGVESGSNAQLRRYAKGQTVEDVVYALRAGSLLNLPLEFGFITFDPLLTEEELVENLRFLARTDVLLPQARTTDLEEVYNSVLSEDCMVKGDAVYCRVAYMATELELFAGSDVATHLKSSHPDLIGQYDSSFARYHYEYADRRVGQIAAWCRVWTEGTFGPMYRMRLSSRMDRKHSHLYQSVIRRYREATFALLLALTVRLSEWSMRQLFETSALFDSSAVSCFNSCAIEVDQLQDLWSWVILGSGLARHDEAEFRREYLERRRDK